MRRSNPASLPMKSIFVSTWALRSFPVTAFCYTAYNSMMDLLLNNLKALSATLEHSRKATLAHTRIIAALKEGNFDRLSAVIEEHVRGAGKRLTAIAKESSLFKSSFTKGEDFFTEEQ